MHLPDDLLARMQDQGCVATTAQALELGLTGRDVGRLRAEGRLTRIRWGAYALRRDWDAWDTRDRHRALARAVSLQLTTPYVFSHTTAAVLHDLPLHAVDLSEVHVTRAFGPGRTRHQAGIWHHDGACPGAMVVSDLPVSSLVRTAADVARVTRLDSAVVTMDAALRRGAPRDALQQLLDDTQRWPGSAEARRAFALSDERSESPGETLARLSFARVGLPATALQVEIRSDLGRHRTDFGWPERGVLGEFDGRIKYGRLLKADESTEDVLVRERQRELAIERRGWAMVRFTWSEVHDRGLVRRRLLDAFARASTRSVRAG